MEEGKQIYFTILLGFDAEIGAGGSTHQLDSWLPCAREDRIGAKGGGGGLRYLTVAMPCPPSFTAAEMSLNERLHEWV